MCEVLYFTFGVHIDTDQYYSASITVYPRTGMRSGSHVHFKFLEITDNISETV